MAFAGSLCDATCAALELNTRRCFDVSLRKCGLRQATVQAAVVPFVAAADAAGWGRAMAQSAWWVAVGTIKWCLCCKLFTAQSGLECNFGSSLVFQLAAGTVATVAALDAIYCLLLMDSGLVSATAPRGFVTALHAFCVLLGVLHCRRQQQPCSWRSSIAAASRRRQSKSIILCHAAAADLQQEAQPIRVALDTTSSAAARRIVKRLQACGNAEVWATGVANHYTAVQALAIANVQLAAQQQGLAAKVSLSANDQEVMDDQKRGLKKLTLHVQLLETPLDEAVWAAGSANHISTNRTKGVGELVQAMRAYLEPAGVSNCAAVVLEARGEQAVTRALKASLSLQAGQQGWLLLRPWQGQVVDVVAEKRGQALTAPGLLLHASWGDA